MKPSDLPPHLRKQVQSLLTPKRSKYGAHKTVAGGITFDSKKEADRYRLLMFLQRAGTIRDLKLQESFDLVVNGVLVCRYVADFSYWRKWADGSPGVQRVVEDVKSAATRKNRSYRIKVKLLRALLGITVLEV